MRSTALCLAAALPGAITLLFLWSEAAQWLMPIFFTVCFAGFAGAWILVSFGPISLRSGTGRASVATRKRLCALWVALSLALMLLRVHNTRVPLPDSFPDGGNAASSLRSTAADLSRFLIELARNDDPDCCSGEADDGSPRSC